MHIIKMKKIMKRKNKKKEKEKYIPCNPSIHKYLWLTHWFIDFQYI